MRILASSDRGQGCYLVAVTKPAVSTLMLIVVDTFACCARCRYSYEWGSS